MEVLKRLFRRSEPPPAVPNAQTAPSFPATALSQSQRDLMRWFGNNCPSLGDLYMSSLKLLGDAEFPGRGYLISHAVREIGNRLPGLVATMTIRPRLDYTARLRDLADSWRSAGLPLDGSDPIGGPGSSAGSNLAASATFTKVSELVRDHSAVDQTRRATAQALFDALNAGGGAYPGSEIVVNQWLDVTGWFQSHAHHPAEANPKFDFDELAHQFNLFEVTLMALVRPPIPTADKLDEILDKANT
jgi:hypothetical protein